MAVTAGLLMLAFLPVACGNERLSPEEQELRSYALELEPLFPTMPWFRLEERVALEEALLRIDPPPGMYSAHHLLLATNHSLLQAGRNVDTVSDEEQVRHDQIRSDHVAQDCLSYEQELHYEQIRSEGWVQDCVNAGQGRLAWRLEEACTQRDAAMGATRRAEMIWAEHLAHACIGPDAVGITALGVIDDCLAATDE